LQATVLAVEALAVVLLLSRTGDALTAQAWLDAAVLACMGVVHTELAVGVERMRLLVTRSAHVGLTSVWTFAGAVQLPLVLAAGLAVLVQSHVWLRSGEACAALYKHVYSTASVILACGAASAVVGTSLGGGGLLTDGAALVAYTLVNSALVAVVVALAAARPPDIGTLLGDVEDNSLEIATLTLGALVATTLRISLWMVPLVLPAVLVLHRAVLVRQLEVAAATDGKTGLLNAHTWNARAQHQLHRAVRGRVPHAVLVLDLDHFKTVNDRHGHLAGDKILAAVARALRAEVRGRDLVGRFGGEEFVVLLAGPKGGCEADLAAVAERIRHRIATLRVTVATSAGTEEVKDLSVSVGGALHPGGRADLAGLLRIADTALYSAKRAGRNQVRMGLVLPERGADAR
jgi:diguanylate cyclase (GGDEF)-like protein